MTTIEDRLREGLNPGITASWLKALVATNPNHRWLQREYSASPLLFESIFSTEDQIHASLYQRNVHKYFPTQQSLALTTAKQIGVIPFISDYLSDYSASIAMTNAEMILNLNQSTRLSSQTLGTILQSYSRTNLAQPDSNYITNNIDLLLSKLHHLERLMASCDMGLRLRNPLNYPGILHPQVMKRATRGDDIDPEVYTPTGVKVGLELIRKVYEGTPRVIETNAKYATSDVLQWDRINAFGYGTFYHTPVTLVLTPRHIPWQALSRVLEGMYVPVCNPLPIPLIDDVVWAVQYMPTNDDPRVLWEPGPTEMQTFGKAAILMSYYAMALTAIAHPAKTGRGNEKIRWCASPPNSSMVNHLLSE